MPLRTYDEISASEHTVERLAPLFWDSRPEQLDLDRHARAILERILEHGDYDHWVAARKYYGDDRLRTELTASRRLCGRTVNFLASRLGLPRDAFRSWELYLEGHPAPLHEA
jgi:hypothetical protein